MITTKVQSSAKAHKAGTWQSWGRQLPGSVAHSLCILGLIPMRCSFLYTVKRRPKGVHSDANET